MELPFGVELVRTTASFDEVTVPVGLLASHQVAAETWGRVVVTSGSLDFVFEDDPASRRRMRAGETQVIPPERRHHVELVGAVAFHVEFHR